MRESEYLKENEEVLQKLKTLPLLDSLTQEDLKGLLSLSKLIKYDPGEMIIEEGQYDNWIYLLLTGKVGIQKKGETISTLGRTGDLFGEMGIIDGSPRSATIVAIDETACLALDISYVDRLEKNHKITVGYILYRLFSEILASRLRLADEKLLKAIDENALLKTELEKLQSVPKKDG
ncbi:cyclic nucleotide-binding domain-containing protein [Thermodesulfobacteriota bacterium]